ncbi:MAG: SDR family oxidoreductase [Actinomycetes bacterium]|jgi:nucleoside-diphosphate-sugar epimerase|nr:MAG: NAD-dependent dehydratase [Actinomycetota bacterium]
MGDSPGRVLVTGARGYIGSVMTRFLADEGYDVTGVDLDLYHRCRFPSGELEFSPWDAREATPEDFEGYDAVVHLAALSNDPLGDLDPSLTYRINHDATIHCARLAKAAGVKRFVFASSCSLYGAASGQELLDETAPMSPVTPYAETKVTGEKALSELADDDFSPTYLRNATVYGPSPALRLDIVVNDLCATAVATGEVLLRSDGQAWRPQVHVTDVARAVVAVLQADREVVHDEAFNIGRSDDNLKVLEIAELVADAVPGSRITFSGESGNDPRSYRVDFSKAASVLGFKPRWTVAEGIGELVAWFRDGGISTDDFTRYRRLAEIKRLMAEGRLSEDLRWV